MGFDLSGVNPQINKPESEYKYFKEDSDLWMSDNKEERKKYFKEMEDYHESNPGVYFRNNVWWWRPLWSYVVNLCEDILTEEDIQHGSYNDGHEISQKKAYKIGVRLLKDIDSGKTAVYEEIHTKNNAYLSESGDKDEAFMSNYPFNVDNVRNFAHFCLQSGGFVIC